MPPDPLAQEVRAWISKAESDFKAVTMLWALPDAPLDVNGFHCQQHAEKLIKALLTAHATPFGRTHDLDELVRLLPAASSTRRVLTDLSELPDAAIASRYPGDAEVYDRATVERLISLANTVRVAVSEEINRLGLRGFL